MTKGRAALPWSVVAEQKLFFITLGGPKAHDFSGRDTRLRLGKVHSLRSDLPGWLVGLDVGGLVDELEADDQEPEG
jgi:hypothetical protein